MALVSRRTVEEHETFLTHVRYTTEFETGETGWTFRIILDGEIIHEDFDRVLAEVPF